MPNSTLNCRLGLFSLSAFHRVYLYKMGAGKTYLSSNDPILHALQCGVYTPKKPLYWFSADLRC